MKYDYAIDYIRALAIFFVLIIHTLMNIRYSFPQSIIADIIIMMAHTAVPLFVMISGALMLNKDKQYPLKVFYKKRLLRIGPAILFWPLFYYFCLIYFNNEVFSFNKFVYDYIFIHTYFHLYFLYVILGLYVITPITKTFWNTISNKAKLIFISGIMIYSMLLVFIHYTYSEFNYKNIFTIFIPYIGYYFSGSYLIDKKLSFKMKNILYLLFVLLLILSIMFNNFIFSVSSGEFRYYPTNVISIFLVPFSLITFLLTYNLFSNLKVNTSTYIYKIIKDISNKSFGIFLIHPILMYLFKFIPFFSKNLLGVQIIKLFVLFFCSYLVVNIIRKTPILNKIVVY